MLLSLIYFVCFLVEVSGVALLVFSLSRDVWYRFGASFPLYGEIQGYGNLWEKCFRVVLQQQQEFNCEALHPANTPMFIYSTRVLLISSCIVGVLAAAMLLKSWLSCHSDSELSEEDNSRMFRCLSLLLLISSLAQNVSQIVALLIFAGNIGPETGEHFKIELQGGFYFAWFSSAPHVIIYFIAMTLSLACCTTTR